MQLATSGCTCGGKQTAQSFKLDSINNVSLPTGFSINTASIASGTTDDTGIESSSLGGSPTFSSCRLHQSTRKDPVCDCSRFSTLNSTVECIKQPPIPPKTSKYIPPLPPRHSKNFYLKNEKGCNLPVRSIVLSHKEQFKSDHFDLKLEESLRYKLLKKLDTNVHNGKKSYLGCLWKTDKEVQKESQLTGKVDVCLNKNLDCVKINQTEACAHELLNCIAQEKIFMNSVLSKKTCKGRSSKSFDLCKTDMGIINRLTSSRLYSSRERLLNLDPAFPAPLISSKSLSPNSLDLSNSLSMLNNPLDNDFNKQLSTIDYVKHSPTTPNNVPLKSGLRWISNKFRRIFRTALSPSNSSVVNVQDLSRTIDKCTFLKDHDQYSKHISSFNDSNWRKCGHGSFELDRTHVLRQRRSKSQTNTLKKSLTLFQSFKKSQKCTTNISTHNLHHHTSLVDSENDNGQKISKPVNTTVCSCMVRVS